MEEKSLSRGCSYSPKESFDFTALQFASRKGSLEQVRYLLESGCSDLDTGPDPALHLALRKQNVAIAHLLLQAGAEFECKDSHGDYPIHIASTLGLVDIVFTLCTLGCSLEVPNAKGLFPIHLAAKNGHISVIRCLCSAGCNIDIRNTDNIKADITALKFGYNNIADLLDRLRVSGLKDTFARQLVPTSKAAVRPCLRILGHSGVGKTSLIKSLHAGLFSTLFKRSSSVQSNKSRPSSPLNIQIEMNVQSRQNSLSFESTGNYKSTNGVTVQTVDISTVGEVSIWELSGQETYFPIYHHFLWPNPHSITAILFNLEDSISVQTQQVCFWLNFLLARQVSDLPTCEYGQIILIATHVDQSRAVKTQQGEWVSSDAQKTFEVVSKLMPHVPNFLPNVIVMDANVPASFGFKQIKLLLLSLKQDVFQKSIGTWTGLLEATLAWLPSLQKYYEQFPVLSKSTFFELLRSQVNLLALDGHINELLLQLHYMGEIFVIQDFIVISVPWLGHELLGDLLSTEFLEHSRPTGVYSTEDFQASFKQCDALGVLDLLEAFDICIRCDIEGEIEYEFPIYNRTETLEGLWDATDPRYNDPDAKYGGIRLQTPPKTLNLLKAVFPLIQVGLRKATLENCSNNDSDTDLYQWYLGSKLCNADLESLITLEECDNVQFFEIKIRGPKNSSKCCFYFLNEILHIIYLVLERVCPGLIIEKHPLSPKELKSHAENPFSFEPSLITGSMLDAESTLDVVLTNTNLEEQETIVEIIMFGDDEISSNIQWGCGLKAKELSGALKLKLCGMLDPPDSHGRDWCLLSLKMGLCQEKIAALDSQHSSHTMRLLCYADCSIGALITHLIDLDRLDVAEVLQRSTPIYKVIEMQ